jgi:hypothetical protein
MEFYGLKVILRSFDLAITFPIPLCIWYSLTFQRYFLTTYYICIDIVDPRACEWDMVLHGVLEDFLLVLFCRKTLGFIGLSFAKMVALPSWLSLVLPSFAARRNRRIYMSMI